MSAKERVKCDVCENDSIREEVRTLYRRRTVRWKPSKKCFALSNKSIAIISAGVLIAIIGNGIGLHSAMSLDALIPAAPTIDSIACNSREQAAFHIHAHLDIIINGVYFLVPSQIGIPGNCFYWLHTHDESGIVHIEAPMYRDFTLGQFFDIWGKKLSNDQIFTYVASANNPLNVYINGTKVPCITNYRDIKLNAHDEIAIIYGTPPSNIPASYKFPAGR